MLTLLYAALLVAVVVSIQHPLGLGLALLIAAGVALVLLPIHWHLRASIDERASHERYPYAEALARSGLRLAQATSLPEAVRVLEATLADVLPVVHGYFYVLDRSAAVRLRRVGRVEAGTPSAEPMPLSCAVDQFPAVARAIDQACPLTRDSAADNGGADNGGADNGGADNGGADNGGADLWDSHGVELVVPAALGDPGELQVRGLLVLGAKRVGGAGYDERDRALLLDLARHFAVAISNAAVVSRIREDRDGLFQHTGALSSALTDLRNLQEQQLQAEKRAIEEEKQSALSRLAAGIVHEINTPLGTIASSIDTLSRAAKRYRPYVAERAGAEPDPDHRDPAAPDEAAIKALRAIDAQEQPIEVLAASKQRISGVIDSLKRFVGLDAAEVKPLDICESIDDAITLLKGTVGEQICITTHFPEARPVIRCHAAKLNQVFLNLIENAAKAIEGSGTVDIAVTRHQGEARVEIRDSGRGMDHKRLQQVLDFGFTMKTEGRVGLRTGLPASRLAIQQLGGTLTVTSAPGQGTEVVIDLPSGAPDGPSATTAP